MASSLEVIDPQPQFYRSGQFVTDPAELNTDDVIHAIGASADGVTRLLLRFNAPGPGTVVFSVVGGDVTRDGGLDVLTVGSVKRLPSVVEPVHEVPGGFVAFALYRAPDDFNPGASMTSPGPYYAAARRAIHITALALDGNGTPLGQEITKQIQLQRPPLVFVHGLWSCAGTWRYAMLEDPRFVAEVSDYSSTAAASLAKNGKVLPNAVRSVRSRLRDSRFAGTQVDVIGHSMGGLLGRLWTASGSNNGHKRDDNYHEGDVRKLITLDTPHAGSPLPDLLIMLRESPVVGPWLESQLQDFGMPIPAGSAVDDLAVANITLPESQRPGHALIGVGGSDLLASLLLAPGRLGGFYRIVAFVALASVSSLFDSAPALHNAG